MFQQGQRANSHFLKNNQYFWLSSQSFLGNVIGTFEIMQCIVSQRLNNDPKSTKLCKYYDFYRLTSHQLPHMTMGKLAYFKSLVEISEGSPSCHDPKCTCAFIFVLLLMWLRFQPRHNAVITSRCRSSGRVHG
jgi:hypothetical protein